MAPSSHRPRACSRDASRARLWFPGPAAPAPWLVALCFTAWLLAGACNSTFDFDVSRADGSAEQGDGPAADAPLSDGPAVQGDGPFGCVSDGDCRLPGLYCAGSPSRPGTCVECVNDGECTKPGASHCDPLLHRCVECVLPSQCPTQSSYPSNCTAVSHRCLTGCSDDSAAAMLCPASRSYTCNDNLYLCVECLTSADCATAAGGPICHPSEYVCVQCLSTTCPSGELCDAISGRCVQCRASTDCSTAAAPLCDPATHSCVAVPGG